VNPAIALPSERSEKPARYPAYGGNWTAAFKADPDTDAKLIKKEMADSFAPIRLRRVWATMAEVPLGFLGLSALTIGGAILGAYFNSIKYIPTDFSALVAAFSAATVLFFVLLAAFSMGMFYPALIARISLRRHSVNGYEVLLAELAALSLVLLWAAVSDVIDCSNELGAFGYSSAIAVMAAGSGTAYCGWLHWQKCEGTIGTRLLRLTKYSLSVCGVGLMTVVPLLALELPRLAWQSYVSESPSLIPLAEIGVMSMWLLLLWLNAISLRLKENWQLFIFMTTIAVLALIFLPHLLGRESRLPDMVAARLGIRLEGTSSLLIQEKSCQTLVASINSNGARKTSLNCQTNNSVDAEVLSRIGSRWLIKPMRINGTDIGGSDLHSVTLPEADIQLIIKAAKNNPIPQKKAVCGGP
jgi:hypothetical protein